MIRKISVLVMMLVCVWGCTPKASDSVNPVAVPPVDKLTELQQAVEKSPSYENTIALGMELANANRLTEAIAVYEKAVQINPKAPIAHNNICVTFTALGRFADAVESCEKALVLEPNFQLAKNNLEVAKEKFTAFRTDILAKKPALIQNAKTAEDNLNVGMQLFLARDLVAAKQVWGKIPANDPYYPAALNNLASSQILEGQYEGAEKTLSKALSLQPDNQLFLNNKRWLESKRVTR